MAVGKNLTCRKGNIIFAIILRLLGRSSGEEDENIGEVNKNGGGEE